MKRSEMATDISGNPPTALQNVLPSLFFKHPLRSRHEDHDYLIVEATPSSLCTRMGSPARRERDEGVASTLIMNTFESGMLRFKRCHERNQRINAFGGEGVIDGGADAADGAVAL